jgi:ribose/xylose/arabinose/galactoside ABC-type transport system permease subunit
MNKVKKIFEKIPGIVIGFFIVFVFFSVTADGFFSQYNLSVLFKDSCMLIIMALGMSLCILAGQINIGVGAIMSLCSVITGLLLHAELNMFVAIAGGLFVGTVIGIACGFLIVYQNFDFWVVTYAFMGISQGLALVLSGGNTIPDFSRAFRFIADGKILGIYCIIILTIGICVIIVYFTNCTIFGSNVYAIGGSRQCAILSGIKIKKTLLQVYAISGFLAAVAGIMQASRSNSASPIGGAGYEFEAIAAVLIGGITFDGGKGKITGSIIAAVLMRMLRNGLNMIGLSPFWQTFIIGITVLSIFLVDVIRSRRQKIQSMRRIYKNALQ